MPVLLKSKDHSLCVHFRRLCDGATVTQGICDIISALFFNPTKQIRIN